MSAERGQRDNDEPILVVDYGTTDLLVAGHHSNHDGLLSGRPDSPGDREAFNWLPQRHQLEFIANRKRRPCVLVIRNQPSQAGAACFPAKRYVAIRAETS